MRLPARFWSMAALDFSAPDEERGDHVGENDDVPEQEHGELARDVELLVLFLDQPFERILGLLI